MKEVSRKQYYVFSPWLRAFHWIMVASIVTLFLTGILIATPLQSLNSEPIFSSTYVDLIRDIHFTVAFVFTFSFILRIYGFIVNKGDRLFPHFLSGKFYADAIDVAMHYMLVKGAHASFIRNPMARLSYALLYVLVFIEFITGFAIYFSTNPDGILGTLSSYVILLCGTEMMVHLIHHYVAWAIILFAIGHLYMVIRAEFMEGESEISSMFSGAKFLIHTPEDADDMPEGHRHHLI